jgi:uncharacterized protein YjbJ (UPF0337 family)
MQDKIKGEGNEIKGTVKEEAGKLGGDKSTEVSGKWDKTKGEVQEKGRRRQDQGRPPVVPSP